jgi:hypothetical protein
MIFRYIGAGCDAAAEPLQGSSRCIFSLAGTIRRPSCTHRRRSPFWRQRRRWTAFWVILFVKVCAPLSFDTSVHHCRPQTRAPGADKFRTEGRETPHASFLLRRRAHCANSAYRPSPNAAERNERCAAHILTRCVAWQCVAGRLYRQRLQETVRHCSDQHCVARAHLTCAGFGASNRSHLCCSRCNMGHWHIGTT